MRSFAAFPFFSNGFAFAYLRSIVMMMMITYSEPTVLPVFFKFTAKD